MWPKFFKWYALLLLMVLMSWGAPMVFAQPTSRESFIGSIRALNEDSRITSAKFFELIGKGIVFSEMEHILKGEREEYDTRYDAILKKAGMDVSAMAFHREMTWERAIQAGREKATSLMNPSLPVLGHPIWCTAMGAVTAWEVYLEGMLEGAKDLAFPFYET